MAYVILVEAFQSSHVKQRNVISVFALKLNTFTNLNFVDQDICGGCCHGVVVDVSHGDGQGASARQLRCPGVQDDDGEKIFLLYFSVQGDERGHHPCPPAMVPSWN